MLLSGERQVAPTLKGIRRDHTARYRWAAKRLPSRCRVVDVACGVGYGAYILAEAGCRVFAFDRDEESIAYAKEHYSHPNITFQVADAGCLPKLPPYDAAVCFEVIEHLKDPASLLKSLRFVAPRLFASVPNEAKFPYGHGYLFHERHYLATEFRYLLAGADWRVAAWFGQQDADADVVPNEEGRTLIVDAIHDDGVGAEIPFPVAPRVPIVPDHVAILGLGPSLERFVDLTKRLGGASAFCNEVWGINALGDVIRCDRLFHMDDVRVQERRAAAAPRSNIANMLAWMRRHSGPIYTSRIPEENAYPGLVEFPLQDVINNLGFGYFNSTAAYAVAYAIHIGVKRISLFGCDFSYANSHQAEKGRGCVEFWLGMAAARGIELGFADDTSLMDTCEPPEAAFYGYDAVHVDIAVSDNVAAITYRPRDLPTAAEIEARYDHSKHPNPLVSQCSAK